MHTVLPTDKLDFLVEKVRTLLQDVGYCVKYEPLASLLKTKGAKELPSGRLTFDDNLIKEFVSFQKHRASEKVTQNKAAAASQPKFSLSFGNMVPKFYEYDTHTAVSARMEHLVMLTKFAHQNDKISRIILPFSVNDVPLATAPIEAFLTMAKLTNKYRALLDPLVPELVPYLVELSEVFLGPGRQNEFIDPCHCINPIMRLEERTATAMFARAKYDIDTLMTSMPAAGGNSPVTLDGTIIVGTAEIVGGLLISYLLNPNVNHVGYISSGALDFRTARTTQSSPETALIDCGVVQLMEYAFGGNTRIGGRAYVSSIHPGMQAVFEKMLKTTAYQKYTNDLHYYGSGVLDNGSLFSPEQPIIDMDVSECFHRLHEIPVRNENIESVIMEVIASGTGDFLSNDHTLDNYKGVFWNPFLFLCGGTMSEKEILDKSHSHFIDTVNSYTGYDYEEDKIREGEKILSRTKQDLL